MVEDLVKKESKELQKLKKENPPLYHEIQKFSALHDKIFALHQKRIVLRNLSVSEKLSPEHEEVLHEILHTSKEQLACAEKILDLKNKKEIVPQLRECWLCKDANVSGDLLGGIVLCYKKSCSGFESYMQFCRVLYGGWPHDKFNEGEAISKEEEIDRTMYV